MGGLARPHKPAAGEEVPLARMAFELVHKNAGRISAILALVAILSGNASTHTYHPNGRGSPLYFEW